NTRALYNCSRVSEQVIAAGTKRARTLTTTRVVLFICRNGREAGDHTPWIASGISSAM
ncbi:unnamed protein product, partial [Mycena citricolor]